MTPYFVRCCFDLCVSRLSQQIFVAHVPGCKLSNDRSDSLFFLASFSLVFHLITVSTFCNCIRILTPAGLVDQVKAKLLSLALFVLFLSVFYLYVFIRKAFIVSRANELSHLSNTYMKQFFCLLHARQDPVMIYTTDFFLSTSWAPRRWGNWC